MFFSIVLKSIFSFGTWLLYSSFQAFKVPRDHHMLVDAALMRTYGFMTDISDAFSRWQISPLCGFMCFEWVELFDLHLCYLFKPCEHCPHGSLPSECTFSRSVKRTSLNINKAQRVLTHAHVLNQNLHASFARTVKRLRHHLLSFFPQ